MGSFAQPPRGAWQPVPPHVKAAPQRFLDAILWIRTQWRGFAVLATVLVFVIGGILWWRHAMEEKERAAHVALFLAGRKAEQKAEESLAKWQEVIADYPATVAAQVARIRIGAKLLGQNEWQRAIEAVLPLVEAQDRAAILHALALDVAAQGYEQGGEYVKAAELYQRLLDLPNPIDLETALRGAVRTLVARGEFAEAMALIRRVEVPQDVRDAEALWVARSERGVAAGK
ncbi:MAG: hypothetical protein HY543_10280 [Deltaproteobacteria bacterium]|nr:hypothetical protein [Deltaproteobacteria bacterium]